MITPRLMSVEAQDGPVSPKRLRLPVAYASQLLLCSAILSTTFFAAGIAIMPQDMPPTGGYDPVQYRRNLPVRGFRPVYYLVAVASIMTYGFYRYGQGIREQK